MRHDSHSPGKTSIHQVIMQVNVTSAAVGGIEDTSVHHGAKALPLQDSGTPLVLRSEGQCAGTGQERAEAKGENEDNTQKPKEQSGRVRTRGLWYESSLKRQAETQLGRT